LTLTRTATSTMMTSMEISLTQGYGDWIGAVLIGALIIAGLFFALRKRTTHRPKQATITQFVKAPSSCIKCGAELPPASDFCNKCGTRQHS
jgi:ribosomal protein L40E